MLKIGDFSKICQVSVKALRHWDQIDLLKPAHTDSTTGYRYYDIEQVSEVNRIMALRGMGLSLTQVSKMVSESLTPDDIRAMLRLKRAEMEQQIEEAQARLAVIESRLRQIDRDGSLPNYEVTLKSVSTQTALAIREVVPNMQDLVNLLQETHPYARGRTGTNLLAVFHDDAYQRQIIDVEVGFAVEQDSQQPIPLGDERFMVTTTLPAVKHMACTIHSGNWLTLPEGYEMLGRWIHENGYQICGAGREVFHKINWHDDNDTVTELQFPVKPRSA